MFQETDEFSRHRANPTMFMEHPQAAWTVGCAGCREVGGVWKLLSGLGICSMGHKFEEAEWACEQKLLFDIGGKDCTFNCL
jgi:hypothetical protein